ncbi:hypothetical protein AB0G74_13995 [Streptomyces sp. NPDC020875]|uniref:hypothetical protein n=1 Tax=Streptomyces sp. NPDC020875 TaxID=3154898 RepID=UPI0033CDA629
MPVPKYGHDGTDGMGEGMYERDGRGGGAEVAGRGRGRIDRVRRSRLHRAERVVEAASTSSGGGRRVAPAAVTR